MLITSKAAISIKDESELKEAINLLSSKEARSNFGAKSLELVKALSGGVNKIAQEIITDN